MKLRNHRLLLDDDTPARFVATPNLSRGRLTPQYLVIHYTAGRSLETAVNWLTNPEASASAHLVIGRDGEVVQLAGFDRIAWHAGRSRWRGLVGLNRHSIGIELDNAGVLERKGGRWQAWFGGEFVDNVVMEAAHKHEAVVRGWHLFTDEQIAAAAAVARLLVEHYRLREVVGHDDIAPGRKRDPGPAFPLEALRGLAEGRRDDEPELFEAVTALNIREGPGVEFAKLPESPLGKGTRLRLMASEASWCAVDVLDADGESVATGWVHGDFICPTA